MEKEGPRFPPPTQKQVAYRALCLHAVVIRAEFEIYFKMSDDPHHPALAGLPPRVNALQSWMKEQGLPPHLSPIERDYWFTELLGEWEEQAILDGSWRKESLGILLWALSMVPKFPPYDTEFSKRVHTDTLGWLQPVTPYLDMVRLRPRVEIERARDVAELWHWRARTTQLQRERIQPPPGYNFKKSIARAADFAYRNGDIPQPIKHDFPAFGKPFARLSDQEYSIAMSIAKERHFALNWLCGYSQEWDNTPTDT